MIKHFLGIAGVATLVTACTGTPTVETGADAEVINGNLHRVDNSRASLAYVDPNADFSKYQRVLIQPLGVDNVEIIQPSNTTSAIQRKEWALTDADKQSLQEMFAAAMEKQLQERGDFPLATAPDDDVLEIVAMITAIAPSGPKDDNRSRTPGRNYVITEGAGSIAVAVAFGDSETGEVLGLVKDARSSSSFWGMNNSVTNKAEVQRVFNSWATQINTALARATGRDQ